MELNEGKSKVMIFNCTKRYQFSTRIFLNNSVLETISETCLLGTILSSDLTWHKNLEMLTRKGYQRMTILRNLFEFDIPVQDLVMIYTLYIRSILEFNSNVWFSSITIEESDNIERVQKIAFRIILKENYESYENALMQLNLQTLSERRTMLAERFATKCSKSEKFRDWFPKNEKENIYLRNPNEFNVNFAKKGRLFKSSIPAMHRLLNK